MCNWTRDAGCTEDAVHHKLRGQTCSPVQVSLARPAGSSTRSPLWPDAPSLCPWSLVEACLHEVPVVLLCPCGVSLLPLGGLLQLLLVRTQGLHEQQELLLTLRWAFPCERATCASDLVRAPLDAGRRTLRCRTLRRRTLRDNTILPQEALLGRRLLLCGRTLLLAAVLRRR